MFILIVLRQYMRCLFPICSSQVAFSMDQVSNILGVTRNVVTRNVCFLLQSQLLGNAAKQLSAHFIKYQFSSHLEKSQTHKHAKPVIFYLKGLPERIPLSLTSAMPHLSQMTDVRPHRHHLFSLCFILAILIGVQSYACFYL